MIFAVSNLHVNRLTGFFNHFTFTNHPPLASHWLGPFAAMFIFAKVPFTASGILPVT
jgi:hypothetical protein